MFINVIDKCIFCEFVENITLWVYSESTFAIGKANKLFQYMDVLKTHNQEVYPYEDDEKVFDICISNSSCSRFGFIYFTDHHGSGRGFK